MTNTEPPIPSREPTYPTSGGLPIAPAVPLVTGYTPAELEALAGGRLVPAPLLDDRKVHIAYILLIFLGLLGVHKFYLGSIVWGIVYFFTLGLFGIGVIVDIFTLNNRTTPPTHLRRGAAPRWIFHNSWGAFALGAPPLLSVLFRHNRKIRLRLGTT